MAAVETSLKCDVSRYHKLNLSVNQNGRIYFIRVSQSMPSLLRPLSEYQLMRVIVYCFARRGSTPHVYLAEINFGYLLITITGNASESCIITFLLYDAKAISEYKNKYKEMFSCGRCGHYDT